MSDDKLLDHEYDGIREQDNPLPGWWLATFYITIAFSVAYFGYYQLGGGPTVVQELESEQAALKARMPPAPQAPAPNDKELKALVVNVQAQKRGKPVYDLRCASCHGNLGQGSIGPNLTDAYWIHGGKPAQIYKTVADGVLEKGMPAWGTILKPEETQDVVAFAWSLRNTNVPGGKAPQGDKEK